MHTLMQRPDVESRPPVRRPPVVDPLPVVTLVLSALCVLLPWLGLEFGGSVDTVFCLIGASAVCGLAGLGLALLSETAAGPGGGWINGISILACIIGLLCDGGVALLVWIMGMLPPI